MGTEQDNGAIVRRLFERVWNGGDLSAIEDLVDDQFTNFGVRSQAATRRSGTSPRHGAPHFPTCTPTSRRRSSTTIRWCSA